jgi:hypothetical protein
MATLPPPPTSTPLIDPNTNNTSLAWINWFQLVNSTLSQNNLTAFAPVVGPNTNGAPLTTISSAGTLGQFLQSQGNATNPKYVSLPIFAACQFNSSGPTLLYGNNVTSITKVGTGDYKLNFTRSYNGAIGYYFPFIMPFDNGSNKQLVTNAASYTNSFLELTFYNNGILADPGIVNVAILAFDL